MATMWRLTQRNLDACCQAAETRLLVVRVHVHCRGAACLDRVVERDGVLTATGHGELGRCDGFDRAERVTFDAWHLDEAAERVARKAEVVPAVVSDDTLTSCDDSLNANLRRLEDHGRLGAQNGSQPRRGHAARHADFRHAPALGG